jgi:hypothetical protein
MRAHHVIAVVALVLVSVGVGMNLTLPSSVGAQYVDGQRGRFSNLSIEEAQNVKNLPVQKVHDMSLVFADADLTVGGIVPVRSDDPRKEWYTPRCAERDLRALAAIEEFGQIDEMPSAWLGDAGLNWLQARSYCLSGAENEAVILYDKIIAGDTRISSEWMTNARVGR